MNLHTLTVLIANLPEARQREALERAVTAHWTRLLVALVPRLPDSLQREAIAGLQAIKDPAERIPALSHVAGQWPEASRRETLTAVGRLKDDSDRSQSLIDLAPWLPDSALEQAVSLAQGLSEDYERAEALDALLPRWAAAGHAQEALECLEQIDWSQGELVGRQRSLRAEILAASLPHLPDSDRSAILPGALRSIRKLENRYMFACAAKDLAPLLPEPLSTNLIEEAFRAVLDDQDWEDRASALQELAPCLPVSLLADATSAASQLPGTPYLNESPRAGALAALATRLAALPPTGLYSIWHDTLLRLSRSARPDLLWDLPALCTVMTALGCANAPVEVARTITEVATRWP